MLTLKSTQKKCIVPIDLCQHYFWVYLFFWQAMTIFIICFLILCFNRCLSVFSLVYIFLFPRFSPPSYVIGLSKHRWFSIRRKVVNNDYLETHVCDRLPGVRILMPTSDTYLKRLKRTESKILKEKTSGPSLDHFRVNIFMRSSVECIFQRK